MRTIPKTLVRQIPYNERLRRFHAEKSAALQDNPARSAEEMDELTKRLAQKWQV